jgi:hypothetical protein
LLSAFKDIEVFYWTVNGTFGWFEPRSYQSTSLTKIAGGKGMNKRGTAHFEKYGNYRPGSKIAKDICSTYSLTM